MQIYNTTTKQTEVLSYTPTGCDCLPYMVEGSEIRYNHDDATYEAPQAEIDFWREWIATAEKADDLEKGLAEKLGDKWAAAAVSTRAVDGLEFNDQQQARIKALTAALNA